MSERTSFHEPRQKPGRSRVVWIGRWAGEVSTSELAELLSPSLFADERVVVLEAAGEAGNGSSAGCSVQSIHDLLHRAVGGVFVDAKQAR